MKRWTTWAACLIGLSAFLLTPIHTSAVDYGDRTNLMQLQSTSEAAAIPDATISLQPRSESTLTATVNAWKTTLSRERGFELWQQAQWNSYPLGPGTHGWVVILQANGQEVGYMIVHATDNGSLRLTEYGTGDNPLFSLTTLYRSLVQQELIPAATSLTDFVSNEQIMKERLYMDSFTAIWKIQMHQQTHYLDAKSGELLPLDHDPVPQQAAANSAGTVLTGKLDDLLLPVFDPYDRLPWVQGKPLQIVDLPELKAALKKKDKLTYVIDLYNHKVTMPLAVLGYKQWNGGQPYLAVDHVGTRYVLLREALRQGRIYP
ncbi:hypothetical protein [Paenibacillus sp. SI8]|uniref:hypothetical protein n=1 Tax=unclassified Paenibacillus TaxID=185978 RepID=UPI00346598F2